MSIQNFSTLLSTAQVATYFHIRPRTVLAWVQQGRLPRPIKMGKAPLWEEEELLACVDLVRARREEAVIAPKESAEMSMAARGKSFKNSKELQLMVSLKRAQLARPAALVTGARRVY